MNVPRMIGLAALVVSTPVWSAPAPSVEAFFKPPEFTHLDLSPDGTHLAALVHVDGAQHLVVMNVDSGEAGSLTNKMENEVTRYFWVDDMRLHFSVVNDRDKDNQRYSRVGDYIIHRDGSKYWKSGIRGSLLSRLRNDPKRILVTSWDRRRFYPDVFLASIKSGSARKVHGNDLNIVRWYVDDQDRVRAAWDDIRGTDDSRVLYRADEEQPWKPILEIQDGNGGFVGFDLDGRHIFLRSGAETDVEAIYRYDTVSNEFKERVAYDPPFDVGNIRFSAGRKTPMYAYYEADRPRRVFLSEEWEALLTSIDQALPDTHNDVIDTSDDERRVLILAWSDVNPGDYYLFDRDKRDLKYLVSKKRWIDSTQMSPTRPIRYETRDGVTVHGYLTRPRGAAEGEPLPMVLTVHGGPYGIRDTWGFDSEIQFFASRGYAVLNVNYRGSGGYGRRFQELGYKQWGLTMQDDLTDAVHWAIEQGVADPDRICIAGGSYGGYAVMMGLIKTPELYRCGVNIVGVVDLFEIYKQDSRIGLTAGYQDYGKRYFEKRIGTPGTDRERFKATSPIFHVDKIQAPVFLAHGYYDGRVDVHGHFYKLIGELKKHDKEYVTLLEKNEGHGMFFRENRIQYYEAVEQFLSQHLD